MQSQVKNKTSLPNYVHVMRVKYKSVKRKIYTKKRKEKLQAEIYLRKTSHPVAFHIAL